MLIFDRCIGKTGAERKLAWATLSFWNCGIDEATARAPCGIRLLAQLIMLSPNFEACEVTGKRLFPALAVLQLNLDHCLGEVGAPSLAESLLSRLRSLSPGLNRLVQNFDNCFGEADWPLHGLTTLTVLNFWNWGLFKAGERAVGGRLPAVFSTPVPGFTGCDFGRTGARTGRLFAGVTTFTLHLADACDTSDAGVPTFLAGSCTSLTFSILSFTDCDIGQAGAWQPRHMSVLDNN